MTHERLERLRRLRDCVAAVTDGQRRAKDPAFAAYLEKVARHAHTVTDEDVAALRAAGYSEDEIYEATVACSLTVATDQMERGLRALDEVG